MESQSKVNERYVVLDGTKLRQRREKKFGSQQVMVDAMPKAVRVSVQTVAKAEKGRRIFHTSALTIAKVLEVTIDDLLPTSDGSDYVKAIRKHVKGDAAMDEVLSVASREPTTEVTRRVSGPDVGFDLAGYGEFLLKKCSAEVRMPLTPLSPPAADRLKTVMKEMKLL